MEEVEVRSAEEDVGADHYSILTKLVATVSRDHAQLRALVYEFARRTLRKNLFRQFEEGDWSGIQEQMRALEAAIDRVESDCAHKALIFDPEPPLTNNPSSCVTPGPPRPTLTKAAAVDNNISLAPRLFSALYSFKQPLPLRRTSDSDAFYAIARSHKQSRSDFWWKVQLSVAVLLGVVIYAAIDGQVLLGLPELSRLQVPPNTAIASMSIQDGQALPGEKARASKVLRPSMPSIPLPDEYGAYALSKGQLTELGLLPIRVPDQRVAISPLISTPSRSHISTGKLEFIVFRRDLANSAPDRVSMRVVAQVVRELKFDSRGKAMTGNVKDSWVVRSNSYQMRVAPLADNAEMIIIRSDPPDFVFPAGRYALALKGVAYDFTLDGPTTDSAHCLERTDALNVPVYTECRNL